MALEVRSTKPSRSLSEFLHVSDELYAGCPQYIRPLPLEQRLRLGHPSPFAQPAEVQLLIAYEDGRAVGRCAVHSSLLGEVSAAEPSLTERTGFFSYFDTTNDSAVVAALVTEAKRWMRRWGRERLVGPLWVAPTDPSGVLVEGFDDPPVIKTSYNHEYQGSLLEAAGMRKVQDLLAWRFEVGKLPRRAQAAFEALHNRPEIHSRSIQTRHRERDLTAAYRLFLQARGQSGLRPVSEGELSKTVRELGSLLVPELSRLTYVDNELAGVAIALPNANEAMADLGGSMGLRSLGKLVYRLKMKHPESARVAMFGMRRKLWSVPEYRSLGAYMHYELNDAAERLGYRWAELSLTAESEREVNSVLRRLGARIYKRFRVYEASSSST